jgi:hypothetical protein
MVAVFPEPGSQTSNLFSCLKPCQPAPGIAAQSRAPMVHDPFDQPANLSKRRRRWFSLACGALQVAAIGLGAWLPSAWASRAVDIQPVEPLSSEQQLWDVLASEEFAAALLAAKEQQVDAALADAEQARAHAQQMRLEAEARATTLTQQAADMALAKTTAAQQQVARLALEASYVGAEQVTVDEPGTDIVLKFTAAIECKPGTFGQTAVATPVASRLAVREIRNLATCYSSPRTAAGQAIGQVGGWGVAFFKMDK